MSKLNQIQKNKSIKILRKTKEQNLKGGGRGNFGIKEGKKCPPPFEPGGKHG